MKKQPVFSQRATKWRLWSGGKVNRREYLLEREVIAGSSVDLPAPGMPPQYPPD